MTFRDDVRLLGELVDPAGLSVEPVKHGKVVAVFKGERELCKFNLEGGTWSVHTALKDLRRRGFDVVVPAAGAAPRGVGKARTAPTAGAHGAPHRPPPPAFVEPEQLELAPRPAPPSRPAPALAAAFAEAARRDPEAAAVLTGVLAPERAPGAPPTRLPRDPRATSPRPAPPRLAPAPEPTPAPQPAGPRVLGLELVGVVHELAELPDDIARPLRDTAAAGLAQHRPVCLVLDEDGHPVVVVLNSARQLERCLAGAGVAA